VPWRDRVDRRPGGPLAASWFALAIGATAIAAGATAPTAGQRVDPEVAAAVDAQLDALGRSDALLAARYAARSGEAAGRVRALYKLARAGWAPLWVDPEERGAAAHRRAAARSILRRDLAEMAALREEMAAAAAARARLEGERRQAAVDRPAPGSLARPVEGVILDSFGRYRHDESGAELVRRGVHLRSRAGAEVVSVAAGEVRYAGPVRGLGVAVVVDHGAFRSVIGPLASTPLGVGDRIERGAVVGLAAGRRIYLELRLAVGAAGFPVDPAPLLE
jgi:murein DD-endopeptidase MepM/ murein hydrolase activator NlpD